MSNLLDKETENPFPPPKIPSPSQLTTLHDLNSESRFLTASPHTGKYVLFLQNYAQHRYQMERIQVDTAQNVSLDVPVAGLGDRIIAALVDYAILGAYSFVMMLLVGTLAARAGSTQFLVTLFTIASLPPFLYFLLCEIFLDGQSIGKRYMNVKVTRRDGTPASVRDYVIRWLLRPIDVSLTSGLGGVLSILITGTGQRLGDLAAGTTVVKVSEQASVHDLTYAEVEETHTPHFPEVERLSDTDVATASDVLDVLKYKRRSHRRRDMGRRTKRALEQKMGVSSDLSPREFLEAVVQDYTHVHGPPSDAKG